MSEYWPRDVDAFYISYDEPNCEDNWTRVLDMLPRAKRTHGVKGFDAAHKACAEASQTDRFLTIDGDNWLLADGLDTKLDDTGMEDVVFSFKSRNAVNGLEYGNGGIKCWRRDVLLASNTHESSDNTDFCWDLRYYQVDVLSSIGVNNASPYQAWRAGYREGVKMSLETGRKVPAQDFGRKIWIYNLHKLLIWCSVGADVENGIWSMFGARQGAHDCNLTDDDHTKISDYGWFEEKWQSVKGSDPQAQCLMLGQLLQQKLGIEIADLDADQSRFHKRVYINPPRPMVSYEQIKHLSAV